MQRQPVSDHAQPGPAGTAAVAPPSLAPSAAVAELPHPWAWLRLPILLSLLLWGAEVAVLTPQFEFKAGAMRYVAHPLTANFVFLATVLFLLLAGDRLGGGNAWDRRTAPHRLAWLAVNLVSFALLWAVTLRLQGMAAGGPAYGGLVAAWGVLALTVGLTAWLAFLSARRLAAWLGDSWEKAFAATVLALTLTLLTPEIRRLWYFLHPPVAGLTLQLLEWTGYSELVSFVSPRSGNPVLGSRQAVVLEVTPFCAEVESLAVFCLLGGALLVAGGQRIHRLRLGVVLLGGLGLLYVLNAVRLYLLIDLAARLDDVLVAVKLAHSRVGHVAFLALSLVMLIGTSPWWYRQAPEAAPDLHPPPGGPE